MRIAIIGQQLFGKAVMEAFLARGDEVAGVFTAPEKPGASPDPLRIEAEKRNIPIFQMPNLTDAAAENAMKSLDADIGIMAFVLQFAPQNFVNVPRLGTIQYHPSLLPKYRGPSSINWPIVCGERETGLTIFRPTDGMDEGPIILQKKIPILPDDTLGSIYFDQLFPMGVAAMLEAAALVVAGRHVETPQDESQASYEGWFRATEARINWNMHVNLVYNLIRGSDPAPGAWTTLNGKKIHLYGARKHLSPTFQSVKGRQIGVISAVGEKSFRISAHGGEIEVSTVRPADSKKMSATEYAGRNDLCIGMRLGD
ncbi:methionyl-tRNA formyltransferase [Oxalobacter vibrioformis]|uniref:Methionyl-tRNA formyltransferase n=1 Tax=Oxalobacter vibrioformis TaxID=933080 RepID=A0A9E9LZ78_9BURK|nr:methionyl-tRNA formyltransferase [Oxalobacter vibrioformis]WAW11201.1 methionyl-tRNA formyltransferase [Oxalobacter vibrioformis]